MKTQKFKQTDIGPVPADWKVKTIEELGCLSGAGVDKKSRPDEKRIRLVNYLDVLHKSKIWNRELDFWVTASDKKIEQCDVKKGDVFFTPSSEMPFDIAFSAVAMEDMPRVCYSYHIYRLRILEDIDLDFRAYLFDTRTFYRQAEFLCEGSGKRYVISLAKFRTMKVAFPPSVSEQRAIAEVLSDADEMLVTLDKLIEKKRAIKTGAMQQLLSGKKRLPGFSEKWEIRKLEEVGRLQKETILPFLFPEKIFLEYSMPSYDERRRPAKRLGKEMLSSRKIIKGEVLLFNKLNVRQKRIWLLPDCERNAVCSFEFLPYESREINLSFLFHFLNQECTTQYFTGISRGTSNSQKRIEPRDFLTFEIPVPPLSEQRAIAEVLSSMDGEIEALLREREKYARIKQGMMRELLTGTTRLEVRQ